MHRAVGAGRLFVRHLLKIVRQDQRRHRTVCQRDSNGTIDEMAHLRRGSSLLNEIAGDVLEQRREVNLLLIMAADRATRLLADDGQDRLVIEAGIIEASHKMRCAGTGGGNAYTQFARKLGVSRCHESGHLLMPGLNELNRAVSTIERAENAVNAITRVAEHLAYAPGVKA